MDERVQQHCGRSDDTKNQSSEKRVFRVHVLFHPSSIDDAYFTLIPTNDVIEVI